MSPHDSAVRIEAVLIGRAVPFGPAGAKSNIATSDIVTSGIAKARVAGPVRIGPCGLDGDEQADRRHHGGPEKAVHHYAFDHYAAWDEALREAGGPSLPPAPGGFGENLSTRGLTEAHVCVGDVWRAGTAVLEVSQARQPCWKLNHRFGVADMARRVQTSGRTGWYYRVIAPGTVAAGDALCLLDRPYPDWPLARLLCAFYVDRMDRAALAEIAELEALSASWRALAAKRLTHGAVEDWDARLVGGGPSDTPRR